MVPFRPAGTHQHRAFLAVDGGRRFRPLLSIHDYCVFVKEKFSSPVLFHESLCYMVNIVKIVVNASHEIGRVFGFVHFLREPFLDFLPTHLCSVYKVFHVVFPLCTGRRCRRPSALCMDLRGGDFLYLIEAEERGHFHEHARLGRVLNRVSRLFFLGLGLLGVLPDGELDS